MSDTDQRKLSVKNLLSRMVNEEPTRELLDEAADLIAVLYDNEQFWHNQNKLMFDLMCGAIENGVTSEEEKNTPN